MTAGSNKTAAQEMAGGGWEEEEAEQEKENHQPQMRNGRASVTSMSAASTRNHSSTKMYPGDSCSQVEAFEAFHQDLALGGVAETGEDAGGGGSWGLGGWSDSSLPGCAQVMASGDEASLDQGPLDLPLDLRHQGPLHLRTSLGSSLCLSYISCCCLGAAHSSGAECAGCRTIADVQDDIAHRHSGRKAAAWWQR
jgi:hypothetical protein